jgi:hypothetical protein
MNNFRKKIQSSYINIKELGSSPLRIMLSLFIALLFLSLTYMILARDFSGPVAVIFLNLVTELIFLSCTYFAFENITEQKRHAAKTLWCAELIKQTNILIRALKDATIESQVPIAQQAAKVFCSTVLNSADFLDRDEIEILFSLVYVDLHELSDYLTQVDEKKNILAKLEKLNSLLTKKLKLLLEVNVK